MSTNQSTDPPPSSAKLFYVLGSVVLIIGVLRVGESVFLPVTLALLLSFALAPAVRALEKLRLGRTASVLISCGVACAGIGLATWGLVSQIQVLAADLPNHKAEIAQKLESIRPSGDSTFGRLSDLFEELFPAETASGEDIADTAGGSLSNRDIIVVQDSSSSSSPIATLWQVLLPALEPLVIGAMIFVLVIFLLLRQEDMRFRLISLMGNSALTGTTRLMADASDRVSRYLVTLLVVNAAFGLWFGVGLYLLGVPYAALWGFLTLVFRFIPFVGSPASVLFPLLISVATSSGWSEPLYVLVLFTISELFTANVLEPILFGRTTGLTPIALLVAALFWTWVWGPLGLLLSTPLTVYLVVMGQHIPQLRSLKVLLAEQPVLDARLQFFQRLIARDAVEARVLASSYALEHGLEAAFDDVIVPALRLAGRERLDGNIAAIEAEFIWKSSREAIEHIQEKCLASGLKEGQDGEASVQALPSIYGYPVHHEADEIGLSMLHELLKGTGDVTLGSTRQLPSKSIDAIVELQPTALVLMVVPPGGQPQLKYMCQEVRSRCPELPIVVTFLGKFPDYDEALVKLRESGASYVTTSLAQTKMQLETLLSDQRETQAATA